MAQRFWGADVVSYGVKSDKLVHSEIPPVVPKRSFRLGDWVLVPRATTFLHRSAHAHIARGNERVRLRHCSADLEQFAMTMTLIAAEYSRRLDGIKGIQHS
jgi:hypothetical protein